MISNYLWLIPALPLIGFLFNGLVGIHLHKMVTSVVGPLSVGLAFVLACFAFVEMISAPEQQISLTLYTWINIGEFNIPIRFVVDRLSALYLLVITGVGFLIHIYSIGYMAEDEGYVRFFAYLNLFIFFMLLLVMGSSLLLLFIGWEGVGLCSYLLIGFYYQRPAAASAAKKAFILNRVGDFGFIVASLSLFWLFGTLEMAEINARAPQEWWPGEWALTVVTLLLLLGAAGKSAQIPLYVWLPDAMEGPTPVSALIHAATMVTAGLYLVARLNAVFILTPFTMTVMVVVGCATAFFAATIGLAQKDIKKVLAYSTVSQLGYMFMAMGVGAFVAGIFHVLTHAFFKALLFLGSGSVIHALHHEQDMTKMGGLSSKMPITSVTYMIGALAISGFPFLFSGFFSKDEILWQSYASPLGHPVFWSVGVLTAVLTAFYMFRTVGLTFYGQSRVAHPEKVHESPFSMTMPLIVLALLAIVGGWIGIPHVLGHSLHLPNMLTGYFDGFFASVPNSVEHSAQEELLLMGISTVLALTAMLISYRLFSKYTKSLIAPESWLNFPANVLANKYYVDELYHFVIVRPTHALSKWVLWQGIDVKVIDFIVNQTATVVHWTGKHLRVLQSGQAQQYAIAMMIGAVMLLWFSFIAPGI